ncbi:DUF4760 domain-containing protein [Crocosphaera subtropica]|nr:DUF4760 domain-containing protein [Crocosphaera subtropica]
MNRSTGQISRLEFQITLTIGLIVSLGISIIIGAYFSVTQNKTLEEKKEARETISFIAGILGAGLGIVSAFYAVDSISRNSQTSKINRAINIISEWNNIDFQDYKDVLGELRSKTQQLKKNNGENASEAEKGYIINEIIESDFGYVGKILGYLNFLEYVSLLVETNCVDEDMIYEYFVVIFIKADDLLGLWIKQRQKDSNNYKIYDQFIKVTNKWRLRYEK